MTLLAALRGWKCEEAKGPISLQHRWHSEGRESVWHRCTLKERVDLGGHGDVGIGGHYVGLPCGEANLRGGVDLFLDRVSVGDLSSTAAEKDIQNNNSCTTRARTDHGFRHV